VGRDPWDGEETQKGRKGGEEKVGKRKERKRKGRRGGRKGQGSIQAFFYATSSPEDNVHVTW